MRWDGEGPSQIHSRTHCGSGCGFNLIEGAAASPLPLLRWNGYRGNCNSFGKDVTLYRPRWIGLPHMSVRFLSTFFKTLIQVSLRHVQIARIALQARRIAMLLLVAPFAVGMIQQPRDGREGRLLRDRHGNDDTARARRRRAGGSGEGRKGGENMST